MRIQIRDGKASTSSDWFWIKIWLSMIKTVEHLLPDMELAVSPMDEPRLVVPWEDMDVYMKKAAKTRRIADVRSVVSDFSTPEASGEEHSDMPPAHWEHEPSTLPLVTPSRETH